MTEPITTTEMTTPTFEQRVARERARRAKKKADKELTLAKHWERRTWGFKAFVLLGTAAFVVPFVARNLSLADNPVSSSIAIHECRQHLKARLKDPFSYREISAKTLDDGVVVIDYTAKNGFGGAVRDKEYCW